MAIVDIEALAEAGWHGACPYTVLGGAKGRSRVELAAIKAIPGIGGIRGIRVIRGRNSIVLFCYSCLFLFLFA